jgi:hypothetical protein
MTVVSVVARWYKLSREPSETSAFFAGGGAINRFSVGVSWHLIALFCNLCTQYLTTLAQKVKPAVVCLSAAAGVLAGQFAARLL